jgi:hypothetical protein
LKSFDRTTSRKKLIPGAPRNQPSGSILAAKVDQFLDAIDI